MLRGRYPEATIITPGVRSAGSALGDQKRVATPTEAMIAGADHIVMGRDILKSEHLVTAVKDILSKLPAMHMLRRAG
jgi:orotidine-5'-phosphate decarboxylase